MKNLISLLMLPVLLATGTLGVPGCSSTVAEHEETHRNLDGSVTHKETRVKENPDGSRTVEKDDYHVRD